ncbi:Histidine kinase-, DNA gyrase B-, and HSP90-like ATPase [Actinopolymorpha cephalotaxi]|uniref:histidine kinase n=1 Tax=Actinopolymorpha cephalotaxi TaxID=504797 RepID=A0A1I2K995_9ACTN|nr:CHASE3 domain-containing protein [Actinopolymorpha cephalotaxi]NYH84329.1 signal transduction histidine kinase [Actinopolymorpha cephalotaxi]SFF62983.1 Histidine kinase-, DNA gyrase B-, and HSP90-like ATPase [Actinopolymorpha cephalotaxi]
MAHLRRGLTGRLVAASCVLAVLLGSVFAVLLLAVSDQRDAAALSRRSQQVLTTANRMQALVLDVETGERGYLLTGDPRFLQPWSAARAQIPPVGVRLTDLIINPARERMAHQIIHSTRSYVRDYSVPLVALATRDPKAARSLSHTLEGKRRVDVIRAQIDRLSASARAATVARQERAAAAARRAEVASVVGMAGSVLLVALLAAYLTRSIVRPVRRAATMAGELAAGDLSARLPETGAGEIRTLEHSFNTMGESLERNRDELAKLVEEQTALRRLSTLVARAVPPATTFATVTEEIGELFEADGTAMVRYEADGTATAVALWGQRDSSLPEVGSRAELGERTVPAQVRRTGRHARLDSYAGSRDKDRGPRELGVRSAVAAPIEVQGRLWGALTAFSTKERPLPRDAEARFADFTEVVALAIANAQARSELAASRARVVAATDRARRRIERDLHDGAQQRLVSLLLDLRGIEADIPDDQVRADVAEVATGLTDAVEELREMARGIHPAILSEAGLGPALKALARRSAVPVELGLGVKTRLPQPIEVAAYYVVAEALTNAAKHAQASHVEVTTSERDGRVCVDVEDDGVGGASFGDGSGLVGLTDRVEALGGVLKVTSPTGRGTRIHAELPVGSGQATS